jgi:phage baseplate assembly protein W
MAYKSFSISPTQYSERQTFKKSQFYKGFSTVNPAVSDSRLYDFDLIKQDLLNQFNTRRNERVMNPAFGCIIWELLFEPFTDAVKLQISNDVTRIATNDSRLSILEINILQQDFGMILEVTLLYVGTDQTEMMKLNFDRELGLSVG